MRLEQQSVQGRKDNNENGSPEQQVKLGPIENRQSTIDNHSLLFFQNRFVYHFHFDWNQRRHRFVFQVAINRLDRLPANFCRALDHIGLESATSQNGGTSFWNGVESQNDYTLTSGGFDGGKGAQRAVVVDAKNSVQVWVALEEVFCRLHRFVANPVPAGFSNDVDPR